ncbi:Proteophosphoglycan 5 [Rhodotorula toruloides ATCC 204091]|uniref:Proteophosphoglycan 5 n=1 Tax=Rhodotorula toruloides TaxID=5286 RepID=A0A0K3CQ55_RHOTO|nr:Proteophosphoglycan 5 [Rhodotorula toruloides ATCC 204091]KAK4330582.1 Proteophosphoglycan 5 [Rhodotorula toruloides]PRQ70835.1 Proteophosphoglycan 5 [Rhodotorula toruloides]
MPPSLRDLPFELLEHILELASTDCDLDSPKSVRRRNDFLCACSLVSRAFRCPAQACLWAAVRVHNPHTAKKVLSSLVLGMYATRQLDLAGVHAGHEGLSGTTAARLLGKIRGVRWLRLADFGRLSARVLQNDNLAALQTLVLMTAFPDKTTVLSSLRFPFHLRTLHLFNRSYGPSILPILFSASRHSLTSLTLLTNSTSASYPSLITAFPSVAPNLRFLSLQHRASGDLTSLFSLLTNLTHLECHFAVNLPTTLDSLPPTGLLSILSLELDYNLLDVANVLTSRLDGPVLRNLKVLRIPRAPLRDEFREFGGQPLLDKCVEKGIRVEIGQVVAWRTRLFP